MTNIFTIKEVVNYSWEKIKKHLSFFILLSIIVLLIAYIPKIVNELTTTEENQFSAAGLLSYIIIWVLQIIISIGIIKICLNIVYDKIEKPKIKDLFSYSNLFIKYLLASILFSIFIFLPTSVIFAFFILMAVLKVNIIINIILGVLGLASLVFMIIYSIRLSYYPYFITEGSGIINSLKNSNKITKKLVWSLLVLGFVLGLINLLGLLCLGVGILVTIPISYVATAYVYKKMKEVNFNNSVISEVKSETPKV
ncbi:MAG: hypothetical protein PHH83_03475 [Patescibacteria group bacterium]|nr:hypothetical protein [Patescibacteria group bacterium]